MTGSVTIQNSLSAGELSPALYGLETNGGIYKITAPSGKIILKLKAAWVQRRLDVS